MDSWEHFQQCYEIPEIGKLERKERAEALIELSKEVAVDNPIKTHIIWNTISYKHQKYRVVIRTIHTTHTKEERTRDTLHARVAILLIVHERSPKCIARNKNQAYARSVVKPGVPISKGKAKQRGWEPRDECRNCVSQYECA